MAWYNASWNYRVKVTIASSQVASTLTDFPVYVSLADLPAGFHTNVKSDGGDIRVTKSDETTEVAREVVTYNSGANTGELHFLADSISSSADTDFYIYYGNSGASDYATDATYGAESVWSNYKAVYHMEEDPSGNGTDAVLDSTANGHHLTPSGTPVNTTGKLAGNAIAFDGNDDQLKDTDQVWANADNAVTVQMWSNVTSTVAAESGHTIFRYTTSGAERNSAHAPWANTIYWDFGTCCSSPGRVSGSYTAYDDKYSMLHFVNSGSDHIIYIDGASRYSAGSADNPNTDLTGLAIGSGVDTEYHEGNIDEVRISTTALGADWIASEYVNQNATTTFYTAGSEESAPSTFSFPPASSLGGISAITF